MIPEFPGFTTISCEHQEELAAAFRTHPPDISEFSLGFLFGYLENFELEVTKIYGNICIFGAIHKGPSFLPPIGSNRVFDTVETCLKFLTQTHGKGRINAVPRSMAEAFRENRRFHVADDRDNYDYVYSVKELSELTGAKFQAKRNFVQQFEKRCRYEYRTLTDEIMAQCMELQEKWCDLKGCVMDESLSMESRFVYKLLNNFKCLGLFGGAILIDGRVQAFTIAEAFNKTTAVIHVEKANKEYRGIYQAINNIFCKKGLGDFTFVNREQDIGDAGLRKAKLSYYPDHLVEKFNIESA